MSHVRRHHASVRLLSLCIVHCALCIAFFLAAAPLTASATPAVAVCLPPQAGILEALVPDAKPFVLIDGGQNPHSFNPTPRQLAMLATCDLYLCAGLPFETALLPRLRAVNPSMRIVSAPADDDHDDHDGHDVEDGADAGAHSHAHGVESDVHDPHFWTHSDGILDEARIIAAALSEAEPSAAPSIATALASYETVVGAVDAELRGRLAPFRGRAFLVYHPAWSHFAEDFGLRQLAIERHGGVPSAKHLAVVTDAVRAEGIGAILVQSDSEAARARSFAESLGLRVLRVNPLLRDPLQLLRDTVVAIEAAIGSEPTTSTSARERLGTRCAGRP